MNTKLVTIIIPIYNVSTYIERCARSLYEQTYRYIEYIWVNDATQDESIEILKRITEDYPSRKMQMRIITHEQNMGLPTARNSGLKFSTGDYVFHCDSDDYIDKDMIRQLIRKAIDEDADIVYSDWYLSFTKSERSMKQPVHADPQECVKAMLCGSLRFNVWNKLVKRSLYVDNQIRFPDGCGMGEDMTMIKVFAYAQKVAYVDRCYYHYMQNNPHSFTKVFSEEHWQQLHCNVFDIRSFIVNQYGTLFDKELHFFCLNVKLPLLITADYSSYERWLGCFPESNSFISLNTQQSKRIRYIQQMVLKRRFWIVRAHYYFVIKFIYGIIYRQ